MNVNLIDKNKCCGCSSCSVSCHVNAITMVPDNKGFYHPIIDNNKCVDCSVCLTKCPINNLEVSKNDVISSFSFISSDTNILKISSSGGVFFTIANEFISSGGYVAGAVFDHKQKRVIHICSNSLDDVYRMMGSKYVQSSLDSVFFDLKKILSSGKKVLFSGTPCQCSAILKYLGKEHDNLYLIDLICHGVPSPKVFSDHISLWERKYKSRVVDYKFRSKKYGYEYNHLVEFENGKTDTSVDLKRILKLFDLSIRCSCFTCPFTSLKRIGDITIGDFWESPKFIKDYSHKGCSTVLFNSKKGILLKSILEKKGEMVELNECGTMQNALHFPTKKPVLYDDFWNDYFNHDYSFVLNKYAYESKKSFVYQRGLRFLYFFKLDRLFIKVKTAIKKGK